jgi:hypothetical protein
MKNMKRFVKFVTEHPLLCGLIALGLAAGGVFLLTRTRDSTPPVAVLTSHLTQVEQGTPI